MQNILAEQPNIISNKDLLDRTNTKCINQEINQRRLRWLGHVLRMPLTCTAKVALRWTPQGKPPRGRPKTHGEGPSKTIWKRLESPGERLRRGRKTGLSGERLCRHYAPTGVKRINVRSMTKNINKTITKRHAKHLLLRVSCLLYTSIILTHHIII